MPFWFSAESRVLFAAVIALSVILFFSLIVNGILIWRLRRAEPNNRTTIVNSGIPVPSGVHQASEPGVYMALQPRPSDGHSREPPEYQSLDDRRVTQVVYENVEWNSSVLHLKKGADHRYSPSYQQHPWFWLCDIFFINSVDNTKLPWCYILFVAVLYCCYITTRVNFFLSLKWKWYPLMPQTQYLLNQQELYNFPKSMSC